MANTIVYINQVANYLSVDLIKAFLGSGKYDQVVAFVGNPENISIDDDRVIIEKIHRYDRSSFIKRSWSWMAGSCQSLWKILTKYRKCDLFLVSNPPTISFTTIFLKNRFSTLIYDIYPDALSASGLLNSNNPIFKVWGRFNGRFFNRASNVFTLTEGMASRLSQYVEREKINVVPLWSNPSVRRIPKEENDFIKEKGLEGKFIVLYSGNIGKTHNVELIPDIARQFKDQDDIVFVIIGEGWAKDRIRDKISEYGLSNVLLLPYQPIKYISHTLSSADLTFVSVDKNVSTISIPSKTYNSLFVGSPILGIADQASELYNLIDNNKAGKVFAPEQLDEIVSFISSLKADKELQSELKNNALRVAGNFTSANATKMI